MMISTYLPQMYPGLNADEIIRLMVNAGFTGMAVDWEEGAERVFGITGPEQADLAEKHGLPIDQAHLTILGIGDLWYDDQRGCAAEEKQIKEIREIGEREIPVAVTHMSYGMQAGPICTTGIERMKRIVDAACKANVYLALENSRDIPHLKYTLDRIDSEYLGYCFDSGHENEFTRHLDYLSDYGSRLLATHLNDNDAVWDMHVLPFDGNADWQRIARRLKNTGKQFDVITLEPGDFNFTSYSNLSEEEIRRRTKDMTIYGDERLLSVGEGKCVFYPGLSPEEYVDRAFNAGVRLAKLLTE